MPRIAFALATLAGVACCAGGDAWATAYSFTSLGLGQVTPTGINDAGTVVGGTFNISDTSFIDQGGTVRMFPDLAITAINNAGDIAGFEMTLVAGGPVAQPFISGPGITGTLTPAYIPRGINDSLTSVGFYNASPGVEAGFIAAGGSVTTLSVPGATGGTLANGINDAGEVVGDYTDASGVTHGFLYDAGVFTTVDVPGATGTVLNGINDLGQIVGEFDFASGLPVGFVDTAGSFTVLSSAFPEPIPTAINDGGEITGYDFGGDSKYGPVPADAFVATPLAAAVPEPASLGVLGAGLVALARARRRRTPAQPPRATCARSAPISASTLPPCCCRKLA